MPEKVIGLRPQIDFSARSTAPARIFKEEEPFCCIQLRQTVRRQEQRRGVARELEGKHWMFKDGPERLDVIKMCDDCRVIAQ